MSAVKTGRRFCHVGVAVENLEEAVEFYKVFLEEEPFITWETTGDKPFLDELVGYEKTKMREAMFALGDGYLELLDYKKPEAGHTDPETYNVGHMHFSFEVDDIQAEYERLRDADIGIEFRSEGPVVVPESEGEFAGERALYLRTPDGSTFELYQKPPSEGMTA
jgi:catechol 2,3-dioxygenase-like lactoylglutathione lyase family enzyme